MTITNTTTIDALKEPEVEFTLVQGKNYLSLPRDPMPWLVKDMIPAAGLSMVYGPPKQGKSYVGLCVALAVSNPEITTCLGKAIIKHGSVIYLQIDTPRNLWAFRIEELTDAGHNIDNIYFVDPLLVTFPFDINDDAMKAKIKAAVQKVKPVLIVIDTLREAHGGDENDSAQGRRVLNSVLQCTQDDAVAVMFVHHNRKPGQTDGEYEEDDSPGNIVGDARGGYFTGKMDMIIKMTKRFLHFKGRAIGDYSIPVRQHPITHLTELDDEKSKFDLAIEAAVNTPQFKNEKERERYIAVTCGTSESTARIKLKEWRERHGKPA